MTTSNLSVPKLFFASAKLRTKRSGSADTTANFFFYLLEQKNKVKSVEAHLVFGGSAVLQVPELDMPA